MILMGNIFDDETQSHIENCHFHAGGPLLHTADGTLIGIMSFVNELSETDITIPQEKCIAQGYTNIRYHFEWISKITGLELPKC